ncbi:hypothetical protein OF846_001030 [Rhodotorula toruloides]|nr:hypothetical protein OF846_001030 [Rhodotorula toruloides]
MRGRRSARRRSRRRRPSQGTVRVAGLQLPAKVSLCAANGEPAAHAESSAKRSWNAGEWVEEAAVEGVGEQRGEEIAADRDYKLCRVERVHVGRREDDGRRGEKDSQPSTSKPEGPRVATVATARKAPHSLSVPSSCRAAVETTPTPLSAAGGNAEVPAGLLAM